jgi:hypothetical protein
MADTIADLMKGGTDCGGAEILTIYTKVSGTFAVYRTRERVVIHYSDDPVLGAEQRKALAPLNPLRGQITGLVDGWRVDEREKFASRAALFDRRLADALIVALQGFVTQAEVLLREIRDDVLAERTSLARVYYAVWAAGAAALLVLIACIATSPLIQGAHDFSSEAETLWLATGAGALGALFSTMIALRRRTVLTDLQPRENQADAIVRIAIGAMAGVLLVTFLESDFVSLSLSGEPLLPKGAEGDRWLRVAAAAFLGGFSERLIPDLLEKSAAAASAGAGANPLAGQATVANPAPAGGEANPLAQAGGDTQQDAQPADPAEQANADTPPADGSGTATPEEEPAPTPTPPPPSAGR